MSTTMTDLASGKTFVFDTALPGRDAYEEALAQGFEGTRADWLASLKGFDFDPDAPDWESDRWYHPPAAVLHDHCLWVARAASIAEPPEDSSAVWKLVLDGAAAADLVQAVADANQHRADADTARAEAEAALSLTQTVLAQTQAAAAALAPIEALHPLDQPIPKGWWDTGDRLELTAPMISRALISNWHPGLIHPGVIGFQVENHTFTDLEATTLAKPGQPVAAATNWADQIVTLQPENNQRPTFGRHPVSGIRNLIPNSTPQGAVLGVIGEGGKLPDRWDHSFSGGAAGSIEVVAIGADYIDLHIVQTGTSGAPIIRPMTPASDIVSSQGDNWTYAMNLAIIGGALDGNGTPELSGTERDSGGQPLSSMTFVNPVPITGTLTRYSGTASMAQALATGANPDFRVQSTGPWAATFRLGMPQFERGTVATPVQTTGANGFDVTEDGQRAVYYLRPDGVDDWMQLVDPFAPEGAYTLAAAHDLYPAPNATFDSAKGIIYGRQTGDVSRFFRGNHVRLNLERAGQNNRISAATATVAGRVIDYASVTSDTVRDFRRNGVAAEAYPAVDGSVLGITLNTLFRVGNSYSPGRFYGGAMIPQAVSEADRVRLQRYLSSISGVNL